MLSDIIFIGSVFSALITAYLLLFDKIGYQLFTDRLLAILLIAYSWCSIGYLAISMGWIIDAPHFYRTTAPINYIIPPLGYLYVRSVLENNNRFKKWDWLHLLPLVFITFNYLPLYLKSGDAKLAVVKAVVLNYDNNYYIQDGFFPEWIQFLRPIQSIVYIIFQWQLLIQFKRKFPNTYFGTHTKKVIKWLEIFSWSITVTILTFLVFVVGAIIALVSGTPIAHLLSLSSLPISISLFVLTSYLILHPTAFIGLPYLENTTNSYSINGFSESSQSIKENTYENEVVAIQAFFSIEKPYLSDQLSINELSYKLAIPTKVLSFILNHYFGKNFNDFVNSYRIQFVVDKMKEGALNNYTIYALASQAGFGNKTSFLNAFKKIHHCTPKVFLQKEQ